MVKICESIISELFFVVRSELTRSIRQIAKVLDRLIILIYPNKKSYEVHGSARKSRGALNLGSNPITYIWKVR